MTFVLVLWLLEPAAFPMTRRMLLGLKQRAETLAREASCVSSSHAYAGASPRPR